MEQHRDREPAARQREIREVTDAEILLDEIAQVRKRALSQAAHLAVEYNFYGCFDVARAIVALPEDAEEYEG